MTTGDRYWWCFIHVFYVWFGVKYMSVNVCVSRQISEFNPFAEGHDGPDESCSTTKISRS